MNRRAAVLFALVAIQGACAPSPNPVVDGGAPDGSSAPDRSGIEDAVDAPDVPPSVDAPDVPPSVDAPDVPPSVDAPDVPPAVDAPDVPPAVDLSDVPPAIDVPDVPPAIDVPDVPPTVDVPDVPPVDVPRVPDVSLPAGELVSLWPTATTSVLAETFAACDAPVGTVTLPAPHAELRGAFPSRAGTIVNHNCGGLSSAADPRSVEVVYLLRVTARTVVTVAPVAPTDTSPRLMLRRDCRALDSQVTCDVNPGAGNLLRVELAPGAYSLIIKNRSITGPAAYALNIDAAAPLAGLTCLGATPLSPGDSAPLPASSVDAALTTGACGSPAREQRRFLDLLVPPRSFARLAVRGTPVGASVGRYVEVDGCESPRCLSCTPVPSALTSPWTVAVNTTDAPRRARISLAYTSERAGTIDYTAPAIDVGQYCDAARPLGPDEVVTDVRLDGSVLDRRCDNSFPHRARFFAITAPPRRTVRVAVTGVEGSASGVAQLVTGCPADDAWPAYTLPDSHGVTFLDRASFGASLPSTLSLVNPGATPRTAILALFMDYRGTVPVPGPVTVTTRSAPLLDGHSCREPVVVDADHPAVGLSTADGAERQLCGGRPDLAGARYFRTRVPPGQTATVRLTGAGTLTERTSCENDNCTSFAVAMLSGGERRITLPNPGVFPRDVVFMVQGGYDAPGAYTVAVTTAPFVGTATPYRVTAVPAACVDLGSILPSAEIAARSTRVAGDVIPMPFPWRYFQRDATAFGVAVSGGIAVGATAFDVLGRSFYTPRAPLPAGVPAGMIYPNVPQGILGPPAEVRAALLRGAAQRVIVEWRESPNAATLARTRTQVHLVAADGSIEFHYCAIDPADDSYATGGESVLGLVSPDGATALNWLYRSPRALATGTAVRFSPP